jgi:hypothetical protein
MGHSPKRAIGVRSFAHRMDAVNGKEVATRPATRPGTRHQTRAHKREAAFCAAIRRVRRRGRYLNPRRTQRPETVFETVAREVRSSACAGGSRARGLRARSWCDRDLVLRVLGASYARASNCSEVGRHAVRRWVGTPTASAREREADRRQSQRDPRRLIRLPDRHALVATAPTGCGVKRDGTRTQLLAGAGRRPGGCVRADGLGGGRRRSLRRPRRPWRVDRQRPARPCGCRKCGSRPGLRLSEVRGLTG